MKYAAIPNKCRYQNRITTLLERLQEKQMKLHGSTITTGILESTEQTINTINA